MIEKEMQSFLVDYAKGLEPKELADKYNFSLPSVYYQLKKFEVNGRLEGEQRLAACMQAFKRDGWASDRIALLFKCTREEVLAYTKEAQKPKAPPSGKGELPDHLKAIGAVPIEGSSNKPDPFKKLMEEMAASLSEKDIAQMQKNMTQKKPRIKSHQNEHDNKGTSTNLAPKKVRDQCAKDVKGKPRLGLVPPGIIEAVGIIRTYGTEKYGSPDNWRQVDVEMYIDALMRHTVKYLRDSKSVDEESGYPHLWHMACNLAFLIEMEVNK